MPEGFKYLIDGVAGAALFMALMVVFLVDWVFYKEKIAPAPVNTLKNVKVIEDKRGDSKKLKLAVTKTREIKTPQRIDKWDDMGKLLDELGTGYRYDELTEEQLIHKHMDKKLNDYDIVFLTCNSSPDINQLTDPLQSYVANGGILYASDWRFEAVARAFPEMVAPNLRGDGAAQHLEADIVDPELRDALKSPTIPLTFDLPEWKTAAFGGPRVKTLLQGKYIKDKTREPAVAPLMVKFQFDKGTVIFTSFHNEKQNSEIEKKLLQYLVFSLVTAGVDSEVNSSLNKEGFTPQRSNLLSTPKKNQTINREHKNANVCDLRFALGFRNEGAKLRFTIKSPSGLQYSHDCESTVTLQVPSAEKGTWKISVTDLHLPYENFPFTVTVGEKK